MDATELEAEAAQWEYILYEGPSAWYHYDDPGKQLRDRRNDLGFTQKQMAWRLGVSTRMYQYYELGEREDGRRVEIPASIWLAVDHLHFLKRAHTAFREVAPDYVLHTPSPSSSGTT